MSSYQLKSTAAKSTVSGLVSGCVVAGAFSPWDRALYLSVSRNRPFLTGANWTTPYHGFNQAIIQRVVSNSCYFVLQRQVMEFGKNLVAAKKLNGLLYSLYVGSVAGALNGMFLNQLATVKYHMWNNPGWSFSTASSHMYRKGGLNVFFKGIRATGMRDMTFGCVYEPLRRLLRRLHPDLSSSVVFLFNAASAAVATVASGPFNYIRTMQYAHPPDLPPPKHLTVLASLAGEVRGQPTLSAKLWYLQAKLRVGWGTARVAVGMAVGQQVFDYVYSYVDYQR